jgi:hypothetical protein
LESLRLKLEDLHADFEDLVVLPFEKELADLVTFLTIPPKPQHPESHHS